jgi:hypothetical protein
MSNFKVGDIVRYNDGPTALATLVSPHAGGWHAEHCLGGLLFVSEDYPNPMQTATEDDIEVAKGSQFCVWSKT